MPAAPTNRRKNPAQKDANMIRVSSIPLLSDSALRSRVAPGDFLDCYAVRAEMAPRDAAEVVTDFPNWVRALLTVRGILIAPFGLYDVGPEAKDKVGSFPVEFESEKEIVAGFDDKHLNFRVSVMSQDGVVTLATWVHIHNLGGRVYLNAIMPFHILIARDALRRVALRSMA